MPALSIDAQPVFSPNPSFFMSQKYMSDQAIHQSKPRLGESSIPRLRPGDTLLVASHNRDKVKEIEALLTPYGLVVTSSADLGLDEPEETGQNFAANAELKARHAAQAAQLPSLADDSGLAVDALGGQPGIYSARWSLTKRGGKRDFRLAMQRVFDEMPADAAPTAHFICALCIAWPDLQNKTLQNKPAVFIGRTDGRVVWPPRGTQGFGYDPIFIPEGHAPATTFGEMAPYEKDRFSHRRQAFDRFAQTCLPTLSSIRAQ